MQLSFLNEFTYFSNDEAIDRVITKDGVRFVQLKDDEKPYGLNELMKNISFEMFIVSDLHIGDPVDNWTDKRDKIISTINNIVGKNDKLLILGDLTAHSNTTNINDIVTTIKCLNCENLYLVLGNNDIYSIDSYVRMGFKAIVDKFIWRNYIFTHMPIWVHGKEINIHGHLHEEIRYENVDWHNHIRIWDDNYKPIKFKEVLRLFESGYYKGVTLTSEEIKTEWEAKQKIEEIETTINSVFDEIEKLSDEFSVSKYIKNIYDGNVEQSKIPLYEVYNRFDSRLSGKPMLVTGYDEHSIAQNAGSDQPACKRVKKFTNDLFFDYYANFNTMIDKIDNILKNASTETLQFVREESSDDVYKIYLTIRKDVSEKITIITDKRVKAYFNTNDNALISTDAIITSETYLNSIMKSLFIYDPKFDYDLLHRPEDAVKLYDAYINNKIYDISNVNDDARFNRKIDILIRNNMIAMMNAGKSDEYIINKTKEDFFSDYKSKDEILLNASFRLHNFVDCLRAIKTALFFNALSVDDDIQRLINLKSPVERSRKIANEYRSYIPRLTDSRNYVIGMPNGGKIIVSVDLYKQIFDLDKGEQLSYLVNPVWYTMNGYDYVIYSHGYTEKQFHEIYDNDPLFGKAAIKYKNSDDFYMQMFYYDGQLFGTLNLLIDHINKKWSQDRPCRIMCLVCNESPELATPKLIKQFADPQCTTVDVSVGISKIIIETTIDDVDNVQELYNQSVEYCDSLVQDIDEVKDALVNRFEMLAKFDIKHFYVQNMMINTNAECDYVNYRNYKDFKNAFFKLYHDFCDVIEKEMRINMCYLKCISNYIRYTGKLLDNRNKVAFTGIVSEQLTYSSINEYSGCIEPVDIDLESLDLSNQKYIYVVSFRYNSLFSTVIRAYTLSQYNHSAIALDDNLSPMYTYVREYPRAKSVNYDNKNGFAHEFLDDILQKDPNSLMKVIAIPVTEEQYDIAKALIQGYEKNIEDTSYDYGNLVANVFKVKRNIYDIPEDTMVCSEFVAYILHSIGYKRISKSVNLTTPNDISLLDNKIIGAKCIYKGKVKDYKK